MLKVGTDERYCVTKGKMIRVSGFCFCCRASFLSSSVVSARVVYEATSLLTKQGLLTVSRTPDNIAIKAMTTATSSWINNHRKNC